jgi:hypothetical protein
MKHNELEEKVNKIHDNFLKSVQKQIKEIQPEIEENPPIEEIKAMLGEVPAQIDFIRGKAIEVNKELYHLKWTIKTKKTGLEALKSNLRQNYIQKHQETNREYIEKLNELKKEMQSGQKKLNQAFVNEYIKAYRPEKPTQSMLDDYANLKTENQQKDILKLEKKVLEYEQLHSILNALAEKYDNKKFAVYKHADIYELELKNGLRNK